MLLTVCKESVALDPLDLDESSGEHEDEENDGRNDPADSAVGGVGPHRANP